MKTFTLLALAGTAAAFAPAPRQVRKRMLHRCPPNTEFWEKSTRHDECFGLCFRNACFCCSNWLFQSLTRAFIL